jgi:hypothetical protein
MPNVAARKLSVPEVGRGKDPEQRRGLGVAERVTGRVAAAVELITPATICNFT